MGYLNLKWLAHAAAELPIRPDSAYNNRLNGKMPAAIYIALGLLIGVPKRVPYIRIIWRPTDRSIRQRIQDSSPLSRRGASATLQAYTSVGVHSAGLVDRCGRWQYLTTPSFLQSLDLHVTRRDHPHPPFVPPAAIQSCDLSDRMIALVDQDNQIYFFHVVN